MWPRTGEGDPESHPQLFISTQHSSHITTTAGRGIRLGNPGSRLPKSPDRGTGHSLTLQIQANLAIQAASAVL